MSDEEYWLVKAERARRLIAAGYDSVTEKRLKAAAVEVERLALIARGITRQRGEPEARLFSKPMPPDANRQA